MILLFLNILKQLADQNKYLEQKEKLNLKKINSLIDIRLPYFSNYYRTILYCKNDQKNKTKNLSMDDFHNNSIDKLINIGLNKDILKDEIKLIKEEINKATAPKILKSYKKIEQLKNRNLMKIN
jgi:hypothetical protein